MACLVSQQTSIQETTFKNNSRFCYHNWTQISSQFHCTLKEGTDQDKQKSHQQSTKLSQKGSWQMIVWMQNISKMTDCTTAKCLLLFVTARASCPLQWLPDCCLASRMLQRQEEKAVQSEHNSTFLYSSHAKEKGENPFFLKVFISQGFQRALLTSVPDNLHGFILSTTLFGRS